MTQGYKLLAYSWEVRMERGSRVFRSMALAVGLVVVAGSIPAGLTWRGRTPVVTRLNATDAKRWAAENRAAGIISGARYQIESQGFKVEDPIVFKIERPSLFGSLFADDYWSSDGYVYLAPYSDGDSSTLEAFAYAYANAGAEVHGYVQADAYGNVWSWGEGGAFGENTTGDALDKAFGMFSPTAYAALNCDDAGQMFSHTMYGVFGSLVQNAGGIAIGCGFTNFAYFGCFGATMAANALTAFLWYGGEDIYTCIRYAEHA